MFVLVLRRAMDTNREPRNSNDVSDVESIDSEDSAIYVSFDTESEDSRDTKERILDPRGKNWPDTEEQIEQAYQDWYEYKTAKKKNKAKTF